MQGSIDNVEQEYFNQALLENSEEITFRCEFNHNTQVINIRDEIINIRDDVRQSLVKEGMKTDIVYPCHICQKEMNGIWETICSCCKKPTCYDHSSEIDDKWVCNKCSKIEAEEDLRDIDFDD